MNAIRHVCDFFNELHHIGRYGVAVWKLVPRPHKWTLGGAAALMAATSVCNTTVPLLLGRMVDQVQKGTVAGLDGRQLFWLAAFFLFWIAAMYAVREGLNVLRRYLVESSCTQLNRDMSIRLVGHLMKVDLATLSKDKLGELHGRIFRSVGGFVRFLRLGFLDFIPAILTGLFALIATISKEPMLGLVMLGVVPLAVYLTIRQIVSQKDVRLDLMRSCERIDGTIVENLSGIEYVRAANTADQEMARLDDATRTFRTKELRHHFEMSLFGCGKSLNEGFFHVLVLGAAVYFAALGQISFGDVLTFSILYLGVMTPLAEIHRVIDVGHESSLHVAELLKMLEQPIDRSFVPSAPREPRFVLREPVIESDHLNVEYTTLEGRQCRALDDLTLMVRHGETIGIAGQSGCGKSTFLKVLMRLTHPCSGEMRLGGVPLDNVTRSDIGRLIGYVGQTPFVFSGTVAENIAYGNGDVTREQIEIAAKQACIHDDIIRLPHGYDTRMTERGQNLSGGQRQRLAIARTLLKNPEILILDEATSALDNISERQLQRSLRQLEGERTTILVAHRLTTLKDADRIFVFKDGRVVEVGTYEELLRRNGTFTELVLSAEKSLVNEKHEATVTTVTIPANVLS